MLDWNSCQICYPLEIKLFIYLKNMECFGIFNIEKVTFGTWALFGVYFWIWDVACFPERV